MQGQTNPGVVQWAKNWMNRKSSPSCFSIILLVFLCWNCLILMKKVVRPKSGWPRHQVQLLILLPVFTAINTNTVVSPPLIFPAIPPTWSTENCWTPTIANNSSSYNDKLDNCINFLMTWNTNTGRLYWRWYREKYARRNYSCRNATVTVHFGNLRVNKRIASRHLGLTRTWNNVALNAQSCTTFFQTSCSRVLRSRVLRDGLVLGIAVYHAFQPTHSVNVKVIITKSYRTTNNNHVQSVVNVFNWMNNSGIETINSIRTANKCRLMQNVTSPCMCLCRCLSLRLWKATTSLYKLLNKINVHFKDLRKGSHCRTLTTPPQNSVPSLYGIGLRAPYNLRTTET